ncbi:hypothetical protein BDW42DRAFT_15152 [Aspergillus taichungensis]|uniref:Myb-like domain-containing protein n=1 Tax=Aspergillus taichungensis TaxID=482145 RepID=A0A2J5HIR6_9EURO|nr:hypothetical protein BDW42DRAFT_15152 [Aspergillus taichungensis]
MLLPSALSCDMRRPVSRSRFTPSRLLTTPPPSDDDSPPSNGLLGTCRALQSLLRSPSPSPRRTKPQRLQSPLQIRPAPSARSRNPKTHPPSQQQPQPQSATITLRPRQPSHTPQSPPPRGANKRRRDSCEEEDDDEDRQDSDVMRHRHMRFSTPKRPRHVPYDLPLGLTQSDFYTLHSPPITQSPPSPAISRQVQRDDDGTAPYDPDAALPSIEEADESSSSSSSSSAAAAASASTEPAPVPDWTADDDQRLVQVVLEKFQLSRSDWDDCASRMGLDQASVGRRWQALVGDGNVGLRRGGRMRRGRIDEKWM